MVPDQSRLRGMDDTGVRVSKPGKAPETHRIFPLLRKHRQNNWGYNGSRQEKGVK
jgi:hypothetical protein